MGLPVLPEDLCLVLGGDGTMLQAIHAKDAKGRFFGINCGNLGFLMNDIPGSPEQVVTDVLNMLQTGKIQSRSFPCLWMEAEGPDGNFSDFAVNDAYVARETGQTCHLRVAVDGVEVVSRLICDGLIAATPLGSTGYSFSANGPAAHPLVEAIMLTAICPHAPRLSPMVLPPNTEIRIDIQHPNHRPARASVDGQDRGRVHTVRIRQAQHRASLCFAPDHNYTTTLINKIIAV